MTFEELQAEVEALRAQLKPMGLPLETLPLRALGDYLREHLAPEGDHLLLKHSVTDEAIGVLPSASITLSANQSLTNGAVVPLDVERWDHAGMVSVPVNSRITVKRAGIFVIEAHAVVAKIGGDSGKIFLRLRKNGATTLIDGPTTQSNGAGDYGVAATVIERLTEDDYLELLIFHGEGTARTVYGPSTYPVALTMLWGGFTE